jgi:glutaminyl-peptide cyclotransferase
LRRPGICWGLILFMAGFAATEARCAGAESLWKNFSGEDAFTHVKRLVELGPRPAGSAALEKSRVYITQQLKAFGWNVNRQTFSAKTPRGTMTFANLIATFRSPDGSVSPSFLLCSHYDTKTFDTFSFVGANDGGSSTGLIIEMARVLATQPALAAKTELVFFDGEEAFENFTETDGLYGSRHFADELRDSEQVKRFRGGMLFDMVGDKSLTVTLPPDSPADLTSSLFDAAEALKVREHFTYFDRDITDDHTPLNAIGIPVIDIIDFDFPPWHTAGDTLDKISPDSLQIVGQVALYALAHSEPK